MQWSQLILVVTPKGHFVSLSLVFSKFTVIQNTIV